MTVPASRRTPLQARSNKTVEDILDAAAALLATIPFEGDHRTSRLAQEAGISVGALYSLLFGPAGDLQEAPSRSANWTLSARRSSRHFSARQLIFSPRKSLGRVLDAYVNFLESNPHFRVLALGNHISEWTSRKPIRIHRPAPVGFSAICW